MNVTSSGWTTTTRMVSPAVYLHRRRPGARRPRPGWAERKLSAVIPPRPRRRPHGHVADCVSHVSVAGPRPPGAVLRWLGIKPVDLKGVEAHALVASQPALSQHGHDDGAERNLGQHQALDKPKTLTHAFLLLPAFWVLEIRPGGWPKVSGGGENGNRTASETFSPRAGLMMRRIFDGGDE